MISVHEAKKIVRQHVPVLPGSRVRLADAVDHVLAEDVYSATNFPPFNQSNVDGYAIAFREAREKLLISDSIPAGPGTPRSLGPGQAMRIFTGAPIPAEADTVVMQENVEVNNNRLVIQDTQLTQGLNFRPAGTDMKQGDLALSQSDYLSPAAIGFLAGLGISHVNVVAKPSISIIITGSELQQPGNELFYGQVYESNSFMLRAALQQLHFDRVHILYEDDNLKRLTSTLESVLTSSDMVILCGGISVGEYDFVLQSANDCEVEKLFHKVKQRPGKPLYFGKKENKIVFGLPGNPSSVLTCFYEYVSEALAIMTNIKPPVQTGRAKLANDVNKPAGLTHFLKGFLEAGEVAALNAQESYRLSSYAKANCLIQLEENETVYKKGTVVEVHLLPWNV
jgi:molybdopterin molybdotransferase